MFLSKRWCCIPSSLINIFKEVESDMGYKPFLRKSGKMGQAGVLLLNATLTVKRIRQDHINEKAGKNSQIQL